MHLEYVYRKLCKGHQSTYRGFCRGIKYRQVTALSHLLPGVDLIKVKVKLSPCLTN
jgi:hypothetical protein